MNNIQLYIDKYNKIILNENKLILIKCKENVSFEYDKDNIKIENISDINSDAIIKKLSELYRMYEFTDKFIMISDNKIYPSIFNFVETGILTEEEVWRALLM